MNQHPFTRYALAVIMVENELDISEEVTVDQILTELEKGLESFRLAPSSSIENKGKVKYHYIKELKGNTELGVFLAPNILTPDKQAKNIWNEANNLIESLKKSGLEKLDSVKMSIAPVAGEFLSFSLTNTIGRGKPKATLKDIALNAITSITLQKPGLQFRVDKKPRPDLYNVCLIPDLELPDLIDFVKLFKKIQKSKSASDLMVGDVLKKVEGSGEKQKISFSPKRPLIFKGNFPNPPRSSALGSIALLGAIGDFAKEAEVSTLAEKVLSSLKGATIYMIKYGGASTFTYNHHVIDLAREGKLRQLVDSIYWSQLYKEGRRSSSSNEYQKFDLFSSRFLQLFNPPAFKDFLSFRAEYPDTLEILFNTYFKKIAMIDPKIVSSARILGKWLNQVAYFTAKSEVKEGTANYWEEVRKVKAKVLVEIESSVFAAKTGDALIAQTVTRAGRLSGMSAPEGADLFMEKTASGELGLDQAKNLIMAFSRLKNKVEKKESPKDENFESEDEVEELEDLSNV